MTQSITKAKARLLQPIRAASLSNSGGQSSPIQLDSGAYTQVPDHSKGAKARLLNSGTGAQKLEAQRLATKATN